VPARGYVGFEPPEVDLGEHFWGAEVPFELLFFNGGPNPITIVGVDRSCDCTILDQDSLAGTGIEPGELLPLTGIIETGRKPGDFTRVVSVESSSGDVYQVRLRLHVIPSYTLSQEKLLFNVLENDGPVSDEVVFLSDSSRIEAQPLASVSWLTTTADGDRVTVTVNPAEIPGGRALGSVSIRTNDPYVPVVLLPVEVNRFREVNFYPSRLFLSEAAPKTVLVTDAAGAPLSISAIETGSATLASEIQNPGVLLFRALSVGAKAQRWNVSVTAESGLSATLRVTVLPRQRRQP